MLKLLRTGLKDLPVIRREVESPGPTSERGREKALGSHHQQVRRDHGSHRIANDVRSLQSQVIHQSDDVPAHLCPILLRIVRLATLPVTPAVQGDHAIPGSQEGLSDARCSPVPNVGNQEAVNEHDRLALSLVDVVDLNAVGVEELARVLPVHSGHHDENKANRRPKRLLDTTFPPRGLDSLSPSRARRRNELEDRDGCRVPLLRAGKAIFNRIAVDRLDRLLRPLGGWSESNS